MDKLKEGLKCTYCCRLDSLPIASGHDSVGMEAEEHSEQEDADPEEKKGQTPDLVVPVGT